MTQTMKSAFESISSFGIRDKFIDIVKWFDETGLTPQGFAKQVLAQVLSILPLVLVCVFLPGPVGAFTWFCFALAAILAAYAHRENSVDVLKKAFQLNTVAGLAGGLTGLGVLMVLILLGVPPVFCLLLGMVAAWFVQVKIYEAIQPRPIEDPDRDRQVNEIFERMQKRSEES